LQGVAVSAKNAPRESRKGTEHQNFNEIRKTPFLIRTELYDASIFHRYSGNLFSMIFKRGQGGLVLIQEKQGFSKHR
jgi:hypothetical protein